MQYMNSRNNKILIIFIALFISASCFLSISTYGQCTLTASMDTAAEVEACLDLCGCNSIVVPAGVTIRLADPWDFTARGTISFTIESGGKIILNGNGGGNNDLTLSATSTLFIEDTDPNNLAIESDGGGGQIRVTIGARSFQGNEFPNIISGGGANVDGVGDPVNNPLPVELLYFKAQSTQNQVTLNWSTASELNNDFFTLERSNNGSDFVKLGEVLGNGTTNLQTNYSFTDPSPYLGLSYYRLSQTDYDGTTEIFPVVSVFFEGKKSFSVGPNPVSGATIKLKISEMGIYELLELNIVDLQGRLVEKKQFKTDSFGNVDTEIQLQKPLKKGTYIIELISEHNRSYQKVAAN